MKFYFILFLILISTPGWAVEKCVPLTQDSDCTWSSVPYGQPTWTSVCDSTGVSGTVFCSNQSATIGETNTAPTSSLSEDNLYCWCKMTSPVTSRWTFAMQAKSETECLYYCAFYCGRAIGSNAPFVSGIMSFFSD